MRDDHLLARMLLLSLSFPSVMSYLLYFFPLLGSVGSCGSLFPRPWVHQIHPKPGLAQKEEIGQLQQAGLACPLPMGPRLPLHSYPNLPVTQDSRKQFSCVWRIPCPTQDNALLRQPSWLVHWLSVTCWVPAACSLERMLLLPGSPLWQCPLALKLCQGKQFPLISQLGQQ